MLAKAKKILKSNTGNSTYFIGVIILFVLLIATYSIMFFASQQAVINNVLNSSQRTLDAYVDQTSVKIYHSVRSGHDFTDAVSSAEYARLLKDDLHLDQNMECFYNGDGKLKYRLSNIDLSLDSHTLKLTAKVHVYIPFYFFGVIQSNIDSDFYVDSHFNFK